MVSGGPVFTSLPAPPPVVRLCTIPPGKKLCFPIANGFCSPDKPSQTVPDRLCRRAGLCNRYAELSSDYRAEVDGKPIKALGGNLLHNFYRALSPPFDLILGPTTSSAPRLELTGPAQPMACI
jgi:hypothetical protein